MVMDDDFAKTIGFELKEGRFFAKETNDSLNILLNETAVRTMGLSDPVGRKLLNNDLFQGNQSQSRYFTVVGVVKDFHFQSLRDEITPLVLYNYEAFGKRSNVNFVAVRLKEGHLQGAIDKIQAMWSSMVPGQPFQYLFLDEDLNTGYAEDQRSGKVFAVFSGLAIIIACVGLYGLSAYTASLRVKEIGIRKVMGASVPGVVVLLSKDFTKLVLIAFALAVPLAWWMMDSWLKGFAFRVSLGAGSFALAGAIALSIALLTVSYQSIKASTANPVKSLRGE
jgi:putative ABC transport system permease protein